MKIERLKSLFDGRGMVDLFVGRVCVRLFRTKGHRPFFHNRTTIATFGAATFGVQIMRVMTLAEINAFNRGGEC